MKRLALVLVLALSACETVATSGSVTPGGTGGISSTPLSLGDYRAMSEAATLQAFQNVVTSRYAPGAALDVAEGDLRRNEFNCGAAPGTDAGRGDPPAEVCRRTITASGCTHTWQVHLFDGHGDGRLARTRGLYDRRCGNEGLLGGPG